MRGTSRLSLADAEERAEPLFASVDGVRLGEDLFAVGRLLDSSAALRRAVTDPSREGDAKAGLVARLLDGQVSGEAVDLVSGMARARWSEARDLGDAVEALGVTAVLAAAERSGDLDAVEDELFRFRRVVEGNGGLAAAFTDRSVPADSVTGLVEGLLDGKVTRPTLVLVRQAATHPRGRSVTAVLEDFTEVAAERRQRLVAQVTAAVPLTEEQRARLARVLAAVYERTIRLNVDVDTEVLGGLRVQVGDEIIDASVLSRLDEARRRLAG